MPRRKLNSIVNEKREDYRPGKALGVILLLLVLGGCGVGAEPEVQPKDDANEVAQVEPTEEVPTEFRFGDIQLPAFEGVGDEVVILDNPVQAPYLLEVSGSTDLLVVTLDENGNERIVEDNFFKDPGLAYKGTHLIGWVTEVWGFGVYSEEPWKLEIKSLNEARLVEPGVTLTGTDNEILRFRDYTTSLMPLRVSLSPGVKSFTLTAGGGNSEELISDERSETERTVVVPTEAIILEINTYGPWELELE